MTEYTKAGAKAADRALAKLQAHVARQRRPIH